MPQWHRAKDNSQQYRCYCSCEPQSLFCRGRHPYHGIIATLPSMELDRYCLFSKSRNQSSGVPSRISSDARFKTFSPDLIFPRIATWSPTALPFRTSTQCAWPFTEVITKVRSVVVTTLVDGTRRSGSAELMGQSTEGYMPGARVPSLL